VKIYPGSPTLKPMGRLAKESLRGLQKRAYVAFNQLWGMVGPANGWPPDPTRKAAYRWLAQEIGIDPRDCHIGFFDEVQTRLVIEICMVVGEKREAA
jgi:hypothetical protein